jgi:hypothetical protein
MNLEELCSWLSHQKGMMAQTYAKDLAKYIVRTKNPQIKELSDEENNLKWWISSFEHLKTLGGGISNEMEAKLKEMKERLKKASEK